MTKGENTSFGNKLANKRSTVFRIDFPVNPPFTNLHENPTLAALQYLPDLSKYLVSWEGKALLVD